MNIAIAILNWNGKHWLHKFLPNIIQNSNSVEIYVIDNASNDDSIKFLGLNFPDIKIINNAKNYGFAKGYNEGLKHISADVYCLLNSDVEVTEGWISPIIELLNTNENISAIQPKILNYNQKKIFEYSGAAGGFIDNLGYPYCRGRIFDDLEKDNGQYNDEIEIFWASGCCLFIRSKDFWDIGGFDENFFAHHEEIDLCWRLKNIGKKIYYSGKSTVFHIGGGTLNKQDPQKTYLNFRNNLFTLLKNLPKNKLYIIIIRLFLDGFASIYLLKKYGISHTCAVIKAHFSFYRFFLQTSKLRGKKQLKKYYQSKWLVFRKFTNL